MEVIKGKVECMPEETGYDSSRLEVLHKHLQKLMDKEVIFGAEYTIAHKGKIIANASMGQGSALSADVKMQPDTVFPIASITKPITTVAIMQLVEAGLFRLDSNVSEILPQFAEPPFSDIKIHHLLTHTSGISPDSGCFPDVAPKSAWELVEEGAQLWNGEGEFDWVKAGISGGLRGKVGTRWQYSSFAFAIVGEIITRASGQFAEDYIMEHIIKPLGMNDTSFIPTVDMAKRAFVKNERHQKRLNEIIAGTFQKNTESVWSKIPSTGGGLMSTTNDLIRFAHMMLGKGRLDGVRILGRKSVELMTTKQLHNVPDYCWGANEPDRGYGLGFDMRQGYAHSYSVGTFMHEGSGTCSIDVDPVEELAVVWFVPFNKVDWVPEPLYNVQNIIWSGLI